VKLLFDQNLSPRLVRLLADIYGESTHLHSLGMGTASDTEVWQYAAEHGYTIVSKDADFHQRSLLYGAPPKVIWLRSGNCSVAESAALLREQYIPIHRFLEDADAAFLALS
jgi:predicted nuclease of predicted toxin-antitoxin system